MFNYAIRLHDDGSWATCRELPEFHTAGDNEQDTLLNAEDGLIVTLGIYTSQRKRIPESTPARPGEHTIFLPTLVSAKAYLWNTMVDMGMKKADLARLLHARPVAMDRLFDFDHSSRLEQIDIALLALGKRFVLNARSA